MAWFSFMQAIATKYHGPTNTRGARISATAHAGRIFVPYDHALNSEENHAQAALAFAQKWGWDGPWHGGGAENGYVFVRVHVSTRTTTEANSATIQAAHKAARGEK